MIYSLTLPISVAVIFSPWVRRSHALESLRAHLHQPQVRPAAGADEGEQRVEALGHAETVALAFVAAHAGDEGGLLFRFDTFGDDAEAERLRDVDHRDDDRAV